MSKEQGNSCRYCDGSGYFYDDRDGKSRCTHCNKPEILVIVVGGYGGYWRRFFNNLSRVILNCVRKIQRDKDVNITVKTIYSKPRRKVQQKIKDTIKTLKPKRVVFASKSLGGTEVYKFIRDEWNGILMSIEWNWLSVDTHGACRDGKFGTYCDRQPMALESEWLNPDGIIANVFQWDDTFTGCEIRIAGGYIRGFWQTRVYGYTHSKGNKSIIKAPRVKTYFSKCIDNVLNRVRADDMGSVKKCT